MTADALPVVNGEKLSRFLLDKSKIRSSNGTVKFTAFMPSKQEAQIQTLGSRAANAQKVLDALYRGPVIDAAEVGKIAKVSPASAYKLVADLERFAILKEITGGKRGRTYRFDAYVKLFR